MPDSLISFVLRYSRKQQIWLVFMTFFSFPFLYLSLEIPKIIVNEVLSDAEGKRALLGFEFDPVTLLIFLSAGFLVLVLIGGLFKMYLNIRKGIVGETVVRRLRYMLVQRLLLFPPSHFDDLSEGEVIAAVVQETDPLGGFAGDAFALPVFQAGTLLTILLFLFMQSWMIGLASIIAVPLQIIIIPYLQSKINKVREQRVKRVRKLSSRLGETVQAASEIRAQGTREYTLAEFSYRLGRLYYNRRELFKKKFFLKFVNNFLNQITPFLFYAVGGYLVLQGELTIGALVAALSAHKNFVAPWRELLNFYRIWQDNVVRYREVVKRFQHDAIEQSSELADPADGAQHNTPDNAEDGNDETDQADNKPLWQQNLIIREARLLDTNNEVLFSKLNFQLEPGKWVAIVATNPQLRRAFTYCLSGLEAPHSGSVGFGEQQPLQQLPEAALRQNLGMVDGTPHLFNTTIFYNLAYGLNHEPPTIEGDQQQQMRDESLAAGNSGQWFDDKFTTSWADLSRFDEQDWQGMRDWLQEQLDIIGATDELFEQALKQHFNPADFPDDLFAELIAGLLEARAALREEAVEKDASDANSEGTASSLRPYDIQQINQFASMADNLMFGTLAEDATDDKAHTEQSWLTEEITALLREHDLLETSLRVVRESLKELLADHESGSLPVDHRFMDDFGLHQEGRVKHLSDLLERWGDDVGKNRKAGSEGNDDTADCSELVDIFLRLVPVDWFDDDLPADYAKGLIEVRKALMKRLETAFETDYFPFIDDEYNPGLSVMDNVLFACIDPECADAESDLHERAAHWIEDKASKHELICLYLMNTRVGVGGSRLPERMQQQIQLLRTLVKRPAIMIMQDVLAGRDTVEKIAMLQRLREARPSLTLVWICDEWEDEFKDAELFERCLRLEQDTLTEYEPDAPAATNA